MIGRLNRIDDIRMFMKKRGKAFTSEYEAKLKAMSQYEFAVEYKIQKELAGL